MHTVLWGPSLCELVNVCAGTGHRKVLGVIDELSMSSCGVEGSRPGEWSIVGCSAVQCSAGCPMFRVLKRGTYQSCPCTCFSLATDS